MKSSVVLALISAIFLTLLAIPANAQAVRTWISGVGDDANPCSRTAPCMTFAGTISKTAAGGEINCLDQGGFGAVNITKAITLLCDPQSTGGIVVGSGNAVTVNAGVNDKVYLQGLDLDGTGNTGVNGVQINSALAVYVIHSNIRNFSGNAVNVTSSVANTRVFITNSFFDNNGGGVNVQGNGVANSASITNTLIDGNTSFGVQAAASNTIALAQSIVSGSPAGIAGSGNVVSFGPSNVITGTGAVSSTSNYK